MLVRLDALVLPEASMGHEVAAVACSVDAMASQLSQRPVNLLASDSSGAEDASRRELTSMRGSERDKDIGADDMYGVEFAGGDDVSLGVDELEQVGKPRTRRLAPAEALTLPFAEVVISWSQNDVQAHIDERAHEGRGCFVLSGRAGHRQVSGDNDKAVASCLVTRSGQKRRDVLAAVRTKMKVTGEQHG